MRTTTLALASSLALALTGSAFAQTPAGGGSTEGNMNNPGSVKSNSEKGMERSTGSATMAPGSTGSMMAPGAATGTGTAAPMKSAPAGSVAPAR
ncbi:hypothetical protein MKK54_00085 [Methylobacterium sp. J-068]|nr:hypothetical protein [Methylobacterium sp. J-068]MCJ2032628.1 hypothetical protein [Methylobacterium sp. J-068]